MLTIHGWIALFVSDKAVVETRIPIVCQKSGHQHLTMQVKCNSGKCVQEILSLHLRITKLSC